MRKTIQIAECEVEGTGVSGREKGVVKEYSKSLDMCKNRIVGGSEDSKHTSLTQ